MHSFLLHPFWPSSRAVPISIEQQGCRLPLDDKQRATALADVERCEARMQQALSTGLIPPSQEIALRFDLSKAFVSAFGDLRSEAILHHAARTSQYMVSRSSPHAIDMAVDAGREASRLAKHGSKAYLSILGHLAYALTWRHYHSRKLEDLDEVIGYSRVIYEGSDEGSENHVIILSNLVSQTRQRVQLAHDSALETEAETLVKATAASATPWPIQRGIVTAHLGIVGARKAVRTRSREDFDKALRLCKTGLEALLPHHESRCDILEGILNLLQAQTIFEENSGRNRAIEKLKNLVHYTALLIEVLPDCKDLDKAIHDLIKRLPTMPTATSEREEFQLVICDLLARRYEKTENVRDCLTLVGYYEVMLAERDATAAERAESTSPSELPDSTEWVWQLKNPLAWKTGTLSTLALEEVYKKWKREGDAKGWVGPTTHCVFCRLVLSAITTEAKGLHPCLAVINKKFQGIQLTAATSPGGDSMLEIRYGPETVGTARLATSDNYGSTIRQSWQFGSRELFEADATLASRHTGQRVNPSLIKGWLRDCGTDHGTRCKDGGLVASDAEEMPMVFIDVGGGRLVTSSSRERYLALSYVWGNVDMCKTVRANFELRQQHNSLSDVPFPKTIRDAHETQQMSRDIPKMNIVYGQAFATIVALHGDSADAGVPGGTPGTRPPQQIEQLRVSRGSPELDHDPDDDNDEGGGEVDALWITLSPRPLDLQLDVAKWNTRGWIFQEHLLSRRRLFFTRDAVYFQPKQEHCRGRRRRPAAAPGRENALDHLPDIPDAPSEERLGQIFKIYASPIEIYTRREFSLKSDIVNGFAGVFSVLERHLESGSHAGLPAGVLAHALLWTPAGQIPRRGMRLATLDDLDIGSPDAQFPSWSWAGWDGPVEYVLFRGEGGGEDLPLPIPLLSDYKAGAAPQHTSSTPRSPRTNAVGKLPHNHRSVQVQNIKTKLLGDASRDMIQIVATGITVFPRDRPPECSILSFTAPWSPYPPSPYRPSRSTSPSRGAHNAGAAGPSAESATAAAAHCRLWWEQAEYEYVGLDMGADAEKEGFRMAGISAYPDAAERRRRGPPRVEGEVDLFDEQAFPSTGPGSGLVNILVIGGGTEEDGHWLGHRMTVAVMHRKAWEEAGPTEQRVRLW
ncbi:hypothetical protein MAPG_06677 [Magnaporthiopsis poae ATCC 64411]|uniref:Heterokaryon incompatibility domain-containing protein n=1 Tax=Magnaporthiopsis poae (strain ATCC 64411 / 73-15) TaxID=644358 RepID=A0A0C4E2N7_MAGP6|nr:hypothetical protein MAPG_06677 [Magnaporthiopsis poae ATCC 64411]